MPLEDVMAFRPARIHNFLFELAIISLLIFGLAPANFSTVNALGDVRPDTLTFFPQSKDQLPRSLFGLCYPGSGWVWSYGPEQPQISRSARQALRQDGIDATVSAYSFGEMDSCGNFVLTAVDFSLQIKSNSVIPSDKQTDLSKRI
jgi:hypothetical protein